MDCNDKDILQYLEGKASKEAEMHIETCGECSKTVKELAVFRKVLPHYREGKRLLNSLDEHLKSCKGQKVSSLPTGIEDLLRAGAEGQAEGRGINVHPLRKARKAEHVSGAETGPETLARAAIPRDITKSRKKKNKGEDTEK